jgi:hypothetical protein
MTAKSVLNNFRHNCGISVTWLFFGYLAVIWYHFTKVAKWHYIYNSCRILWRGSVFGMEGTMVV